MRDQAPAHPTEATMMRFYNQQHRFYCGVDLHARTMYLCVLDQAGTVVFDQNLPAAPDAFLDAVAPFRDGPGRRLRVHVRLVLARRPLRSRAASPSSSATPCT